MPNIKWLVLVGLMAICTGGCGDALTDTNDADPDAPALQGGGAPEEQNEAQVNPNVDEWPVRLSAGLALPQTLPNGTAIGFSVDFRFRKSKPNPEEQYVWEIKDGKGIIRRLAVNLSGLRGTLQQFVPIRPEEGPFVSRIATVTDPHGESDPLSAWVGMH